MRCHLKGDTPKAEQSCNPVSAHQERMTVVVGVLVSTDKS